METNYEERDIMFLDESGGYYARHVDAMTREQLHSKSAIAAELAYRDAEIDRLVNEVNIKEARNSQLETALQLARDMMIANDLTLPKTLEVVDNALGRNNLPVGDGEQTGFKPSSNFSVGDLDGPDGDRDNWTAGIDRAYEVSGVQRRHGNCIEIHSTNRYEAIHLRNWVLGAIYKRQSLGQTPDPSLLHVLEEISHADELEDDDFEVYGEDAQGREGSTTISIREYCRKAVVEIRRLSSVGQVDANQLLNEVVHLESMLNERIRVHMAERAHYKDRIKEEDGIGVWYWQDDGEDKLNGVCAGVPVVIEAVTLRRLLDSASAEVPGFKLWEDEMGFIRLDDVERDLHISLEQPSDKPDLRYENNIFHAVVAKFLSRLSKSQRTLGKVLGGST